MRWPWQPRPETRASYTDSIVAALLADAAGTTGKTATATAALEACAALYAAAFARAKAVPEIPAVTPACLALMARDLIRRGESLHVIALADGGLMLQPAGTWDVRGGVDPSGWYYRADTFGPSATATRIVQAAGVVHVRYAIDPARPWSGVGPLQWASATGALAGRLESGLAAEAAAKAAQVLAVPADGGDGGDGDPLKTLKADLAKADGRPVLVETTAGGWGQGMGAAPQRDWRQARIGADWPDVLRSTRRDVAEAVAAACNVPFVLLDPRAEGTSQREALRRWLHLGVEALGATVAAELADKLDRPGLALDFSPLMASDLAGKARAVKGLVEAGFELPAAAAVAGLMEG